MKNLFEMLEQSFVIYKLAAYHTNQRAELKKYKKAKLTKSFPIFMVKPILR